MTPERFRKIRDIYEAAAVQSVEAVPAYLNQVCGDDVELRAEVGKLLGVREQACDFLPHPVQAEAKAFGDWRSAGLAEGTRIGPHRIVREIGRGGMGIVYLAERVDGAFQKRVALKVVLSGPRNEETIRRLQREREILAKLEHPNIAQLLDAGSTPDGMPHFVMEYVDGIAIDKYCNEHKLDVSQRIRLFQHVCSAVKYAHRHMVVHRDLKPSNVLITKGGEVKLLDFGIAHVLREPGSGTTVYQTKDGLHVMTPEYASPEQVRGDTITTGTDIYSLGVLLYELLTGHRPYRIKSHLLAEVARVICEQEPALPSASAALPLPGDWDASPADRAGSVPEGSPDKLRRRLAGDLDRILLNTLLKDPALRYPSVEALDEDLERHLMGRPVRVRKNTLRYRTGKFISRNKRGVVLALIGLAAFWASDRYIADQTKLAASSRQAAINAIDQVGNLRWDTRFMDDVGVINEAEKQFHQRFSTGQHNEICQNADPKAFSAYAPTTCHEFLAKIGAQTGSFWHARTLKLDFSGGYGRGVWVTSVLDSVYERGDTKERFVWRSNGRQAVLREFRIGFRYRGGPWRMESLRYVNPTLAAEPHLKDAPKLPRDDGAVADSTVKLTFDVTEAGIPENVRIAESSDIRLDADLADLVGTWRFWPTQRSGSPVRVSATVVLTNKHL